MGEGGGGGREDGQAWNWLIHNSRHNLNHISWLHVDYLVATQDKSISSSYVNVCYYLDISEGPMFQDYITRLIHNQFQIAICQLPDYSIPNQKMTNSNLSVK